jgi:hypothetical protein
LGSLALTLASGTATADVTKDRCVETNASAQSLRREGKFGNARQQLLICGDPSCPAIVRDDCARRLDELERVQPTIVFDARDGAGQDLTGVEVTIDGQKLPGHLNGAALRVDPGAHTFTFTITGQPPVTRTFVLKEGDHERRERVELGAPASPAAAKSVTEAPVAGQGEGMRPARIAGIAIGGVGAAGLVVGGVFGLLAISEASQQKSDCATPTNCPRVDAATSDHKSAQTDGAVSTAAFIAGGALLAGGAILFLSGGHAGPERGAVGLVVTPSIAPGGGGVWLRGEF